MTRKLFGVVVLFGLSGCVTTSGFNRDMLASRLQENAGKVTDADIKAIQTLTPQLRFPCRIAVALKNDSGASRWTPRDREIMEGWANSLRQEGIASDVIFMSAMFMNGETLKDLRAGAAKYGADALLIINGRCASAYRKNPLAVLNLTIVGGFIVPGSHCDALFLMEGGLVDVGNGFLYASMESEGENSTLAPTFIIEEKDAIDGAKDQALTRFGGELLTRLRNLRASTRPGNQPVAVNR